MALEVGAVVEGTVVNITKYGAFVELPGGVTGLVHISEIADTYVTDIAPHLKQGQIVKVKILAIKERGKYDLSIKQLSKKTPERKPGDRKGRGNFRHKNRTLGDAENEDHRRMESLPFEEKLARYMKESEERLLDLKRNVEAKRGKGKIH